MGKPTKYVPSRYIPLARALAAAGHLDTETAELMGISTRTLYYWRNKHPEFAEALQAGKEPIDALVQDSLLKRALGYESEEQTVVGVPGGDGKVMPREVKKTKRHIPPDVVACIFWLKNRKPEDWRDKQDHNHTGDVTIEVIPPRPVIEDGE